MSQKPLSYAECVRRVLQAAPAPITMDELIQAVGEMRPLTSKNIRSTMHNAITQSRVCTSLGDGRYWWMPHLLKGNRFRLYPAAEDLKKGQLLLSRDAWLGLWPNFFDDRSQEGASLVRIELAAGPTLERPIEHLGQSNWGFKPCPELSAWYKAQNVRHGDSLILTVIDADASPRRYRFEHEPADQRDQDRLEARNEQLASAAYDLIRKGRAEPLFNLAPKLAARGLYDDACPPDPLEQVLDGDGRFQHAWPGAYVRADDPDYEPSPFAKMLGRSPTLEDLMDLLGVSEPAPARPPTDREIKNIIQRLMNAPLTLEETDDEIERLNMAADRVVPELLPYVAGRDREQHRMACQILAYLDSESAIEPLRAKLRDPKVIDDYKLDIITALGHLEGLEPDENPLEYLRDVEGTMRRSQQEFLAQIQDPVQLGNFIEQDLNDLPLFQSPEGLQQFAIMGGPGTFTLLLCLLHAPQSRVIINAIGALEALQLPKAVPYLEDRAAYDPDRKVRRAARQAAERLIAQVGRKDEEPILPTEPLLGCFVSTIDGSGGQIVLFAREMADQNCKFLDVMFNDHEGIKDCFGGSSPTLDEIEELIADGLDEMGIQLVEISLERAREELERAIQTTRQAQRRLPTQFLAWRHWVLGQDPHPPEVFPLPAIAPDEREDLLSRCQELLELEEFETWFFNVEDLQGMERRYRRFYQQDSPDQAQEETLITQGVRRIVDDARRQLLRDRLRHQAWLLAQIYEEPEIPALALVAADALEDGSPLLPEDHPLLREMVLNSFLNAVEELFD